MRRIYETDEEQEANKQGHKDAQNNRRNYDHDKYSDEPEDIAYWQGRKDEETKLRIEEEERQMEADRQQQEFERQKREEETRQNEEDSDHQTVDDFDALMKNERHDMESQDDEGAIVTAYYRGIPEEMWNDSQSRDDEVPYTEEQLFNDIIRDEREENDVE
jgi:hypothetical protein